MISLFLLSLVLFKFTRILYFLFAAYYVVFNYSNLYCTFFSMLTLEIFTFIVYILVPVIFSLSCLALYDSCLFLNCANLFLHCANLFLHCAYLFLHCANLNFIP